MANASSRFLQLPAELRNEIYELAAATQNVALIYSNGKMEVKHPLMLVNKAVSREFSSILNHHLREHADLTTTILNFDFDAISGSLGPLLVAKPQSNRKLNITLHVTSTQWPTHVHRIKSWNVWLGICGKGLTVDYSFHRNTNWYACWKSVERLTGAINDGEHHRPMRQAMREGLESHKQEHREMYAEAAELCRWRDEADFLGEQLEALDGGSLRGGDGPGTVRDARRLEMKREELGGMLEKAEEMAGQDVRGAHRDEDGRMR
ncbi:hypothetical protein Tdes44962_MAKER08946 [Teratosphaeria destructans]|uniref:Uncharacterized protein n=1 Tax=Teratosphaeria destructans TaxID=418781 RepID=A0A9W7W450_9PEZI|nr:hypothetical protein Tdes44962_MAKER08946 [Teratosphaeria destructans]